MLNIIRHVRTLWTDALRSGRYRKVSNRLGYRFADGSVGFCGLGVLVNEYLKAHGGQWYTDTSAGETGLVFVGRDGKRHTGDLQPEVAEWAGISDSDRSKGVPIPGGGGCIPGFNDGSSDDVSFFASMANHIETACGVAAPIAEAPAPVEADAPINGAFEPATVGSGPSVTP